MPTAPLKIRIEAVRCRATIHVSDRTRRIRRVGADGVIRTIASEGDAITEGALKAGLRPPAWSDRCKLWFLWNITALRVLRLRKEAVTTGF